MRIRLAIPDRVVSAPVLDAALEATTRAAEIEQLSGMGPTFTELLRSGVRWKPESFSDGEHFDLPSTIGQRGWGDCDDLAPTLAAELRRTDPGARARVVPSGPGRWHAIVETGDGQILDPSRMAGMRSSRSVVGAVCRPMAVVGEGAIALMRHGGRYWARTDLPWETSHLASIACSSDPSIALGSSLRGVTVCGNAIGLPARQWEPIVAQLAAWNERRPAVVRF